MKGLVSVIVSTYNKPDYLALTLRSLRAQTDRDFEVIVAPMTARMKGRNVSSNARRNSVI